MRNARIADMWRTTEDIKPVWDTGHRNAYPMGVANITDVNRELAGQAGPGHWNDPDMLEVGVHDVEGFKGLDAAETRAHFSLRAMMAAPLLAGNDIRKMPENVRQVLTNREVVALDQDRLGRQGRPVRAEGDEETWTRPLADGDRAVMLLNRGDEARTLHASLRDAGLDGSRTYRAHDLWTHRQRTVRRSIGARVPAHGVALFRLSTEG